VDLVTEETWPRRQMLITHRLRQRRAELQLTQKQVVTRLSRVGVRTTNRAVSSLEHGAGVDVAKLPELAAALDCTVTYLIGLTEDPHRWEPDDPRALLPQPRRSTTTTTRTTPPNVGRATAATSLILGAEIPDRDGRFGTDPTQHGR
jgi:transcriptional regulator with XRE-family HTH domain